MKPKLVRDRIPEIMREAGSEPETRGLSRSELEAALREKLIEEATEAAAAPEGEDLISELADVLEVLRALEKFYDIPTTRIEKVQAEKRQARGGFDAGILLVGWKER